MIIDEDENNEWILLDDSDEINMINNFSKINIKNNIKQIFNDNKKYILCIDIGVINLGLAGIVCDNNYKFREVVGIDLIDITTFAYCSKNCKLNHTKTFSDWMEHIFEYYQEVFDNVDKIILERQPPCGFVVIEQLIYSRYRNKCELVCPKSIHKFYNISHKSYENRKLFMEEKAFNHISSDYIKKEFLSFNRKHDLADAICMGIYWLSLYHEKYMLNEKKKQILAECNKKYHYELGMSFDEWLSYFKYEPEEFI